MISSVKVKVIKLIHRLRSLLNSRVGRNALIFTVFLFIATILWFVMALNETQTLDVKASITITNIPDSVKLISYLPDQINISVRGSGNELISYSMGKEADIQVDYKYYCRDGRISLNSTELRGMARRLFGQGTQIQAMNPDSLNLWFTSRPPVKLPVRVNATVNTLPNCALTRPVVSNIDSVLVYSINPLSPEFMMVSTSQLILNDVAHSQNVRVALSLPPGARAYPDSVTLGINVEPMISKSISIPVRPVNVPKNLKMILIPAQVTANYTVPMSRYEDSRPSFDIVADFNSLDGSFASNHIKVDLLSAEGNFLEVYLSADSVEYIIEQK